MRGFMTGALSMAMAVAAMTFAALPANAQAAMGPADYDNQNRWICLPGRQDACAVDLTTTVIKADGTTTTEPFKPDPSAPVDCFYVYPTVSSYPAEVSSLDISPAERSIVLNQLARFSSRCRLFAPMYRQISLATVFSAPGGKPVPMTAAGRQIGYNDVKAAWEWYLAHENKGRGVVLIGHSQGAGVLARLVREEIDGKPIQRRMLSAMLLGTAIAVPKGADVGGDFKSVPLCRTAGQTGCVISYASFADTSPPLADSRFGRPRTEKPGMIAACVNPAVLSGARGNAHAYLGTNGPIIGALEQPHEWVKGKTISTPFVSVPGLLTARCVSREGFDYLAVHVNAKPRDPRTDTIPGAFIMGGKELKGWGLHLIDVHLFMGNLLDIVEAETRSWSNMDPNPRRRP